MFITFPISALESVKSFVEANCPHLKIKTKDAFIMVFNSPKFKASEIVADWNHRERIIRTRYGHDDLREEAFKYAVEHGDVCENCGRRNKNRVKSVIVKVDGQYHTYGADCFETLQGEDEIHLVLDAFTESLTQVYVDDDFEFSEEGFSAPGAVPFNAFVMAVKEELDEGNPFISGSTAYYERITSTGERAYERATTPIEIDESFVDEVAKEINSMEFNSFSAPIYLALDSGYVTMAAKNYVASVVQKVRREVCFKGWKEITLAQGEKVKNVAGRVINVSKWFSTAFGDKHNITVRLEDGQTVVWSTTASLPKIGGNFSFTVKNLGKTKDGIPVAYVKNLKVA